MSKHTKGPWTWDILKSGNDEIGFAIRSKSQNVVMHQWEGLGVDDNDKANARLIAAAPELLSCLVGARDYVQEYRNTHGGNEGLDKFLKRIDSAIAKAEGEDK